MSVNTTTRRTCQHITQTDASGPVLKGVLVSVCGAPARAGYCNDHKPLPTGARLDAQDARLDRIEGSLDTLTRAVQALVDAQTPAKVAVVTPVEQPRTLTPAQMVEVRDAGKPARLTATQAREVTPLVTHACQGCGKGALIHNTHCRKCRKAA